jgi:uracil-DNA glycosylase
MSSESICIGKLKERLSELNPYLVVLLGSIQFRFIEQNSSFAHEITTKGIGQAG